MTDMQETRELTFPEKTVEQLDAITARLESIVEALDSAVTLLDSIDDHICKLREGK